MLVRLNPTCYFVPILKPACTDLIHFSVSSVLSVSSGCGLYGLKATYGRIGVHGRCQEEENPGATLHVGPIAANVTDLAYLYRLLAFFAPQRALPAAPEWKRLIPLRLSRMEPKTSGAQLQGIKIGVYRPWLHDSDPSFALECKSVLDHLVENHGASTVDVVIPGLENVRVAHAVSILSDMSNACAADGMLTDAEKRLQVGLDARAKVTICQDFTEDDRISSDIVRARAIATLKDLFTRVDLLITPTIGEKPSLVPANLQTGQLDVAADSAAMRFVLLANLTGIPAIAFPRGEAGADTKIPPSVQLMAAPWAEDLLLRTVSCCEA